MRFLRSLGDGSTSLYSVVVLSVLIATSCAEPVVGDVQESGNAAASSTPALVIDPEAAAARWYQGDYAAATEIYRQLVADNPEVHDYRLSLVVLLREQGEIAEATRYSAALTGTDAVEHEMDLALAGIGPTGTDFVGGIDFNTVPTGFAATAVDPSLRNSAASRYHFWRGVRLVLGGDYSQAAGQFSRALETAEERHFPYAHYALGRLAAGRGDYEVAREEYLKTLDQDRNLTEVFVPLARAHWHLGDYRAAWDQLERARIALPWDTAIPELLAAWEQERPALTADSDLRAAARRAATIPPRVATTAERYEDAEVLRVGLAENLDSVYLKTGGPYVLTVGGQPVDQRTGGDASTVLHFQLDGGIVSVTAADEDLLYSGSEPIRVGYRDRTYTTTIFDMTYGHGQFSSGREDRSYRGEIEILPRGDAFTVINRLSVEEYLYSVVPSEMPAWWPRAALEAQAIAARSYTLHPRNRYDDRGFDLLSSVTSAYYPGVTNEHSRTTDAVDATRGLVLRDGNRPLDAVYSANHGGYAEAAGSVWGWPNSLVPTSDPLLPALESPRSPAELYRWLVSRPDSYSGRAPYAGRSSYRWKLLVPRKTIEQRLADSGQSVGTIEQIIPGPRGITGRAESVTVRGSTGEAVVRRDAIRSRLGGLRSNLFVISAYAGPDVRGDYGELQRDDDEAPSAFFFQGAGWGHGVGMDQTGAAGMAEAGFDAETILNHYYPLNEVVAWY